MICRGLKRAGLGCIGLLALLTPAHANGPEEAASPPLSPAHVLAQEVFPRLSRGGDGLVSEPEYEASLREAFANWDRNRDRRISGVEAPAFELVMLGDKDSDGEISVREFSGVMWWLFRSIDVNEDRQVTGTEWRIFASPAPVQRSSTTRP